MQQQLYGSESLDLQVPCGSHNWQVFLCGGGVALCVDCDWQCACTNTVYILNPCTNSNNCYGNHASYGILRFVYEVFSAPRVNIVSVVPGRSTLQVNANMSVEGHLYCYVAPFNASILSPLYVRQNGAITLVMIKYALTSVTVSGLSPSTTYDVYLYAESLLGQGMGLTAVRATRRRVTTSCCSSILFVTKYSSLLQYSASTAEVVDSNVFTFSLDFSPTKSLVVNISVAAVGCAGGTPDESSKAVALPSSFLFTSDSFSLNENFVVHGTAGCYVVTAFPINGYPPKNASAYISIYSSVDQVKDPAIASVEFSSDGSKLLVNFDSATDFGVDVVASPFTEFECDLLLDFIGARYATCKWTSNLALVAALDGSQSSLTVGDTVTLLSSVIHPASLSSSLALQVVIQPPISPSPPVVALSTAKTIGSCDDIVLDPTASSGSGGRPWSKIQWMVSGSGAPAGSAAAITTFLNTYHNTTTSSVIRVSKSLFSSEGTLIITLLLENFLGVSATTTCAINILSSTSIPQVQIMGSSKVSMYRKDVLRLFASAAGSPCGNSSSLALLYSWKVYKDANYLPNVVSTSLNDRVFLIPAYSLDALTRYFVYVTVTTVTGASNSDSVQVYVGRAGVQAVISGGSQRKVSSMSLLAIDASSSYDIDYPTATNLKYTWKCFITSPTYGSPCQLSLPNAAILAFSAGRLTSDTTYNFTVMSVSSSDGSSSSSSVAVTVIPQPLPSISFNKMSSKYNAGDRTVVSATVNASFSFMAVWSCPNGGLNLSSVSRSPLSVTFSGGLQSVSLAIAPNSMTAGLTYQFQLSAAYASSPAVEGSASVSIVANGPPYGGSLSVSPSEGYALSTMFYYNTYDWIDSPSDYPLQYSMGYYSSEAQVLFVRSLNPIAYVNTFLGQGLASADYATECVAYSSDIYGATAKASSKVIVLPTKSLNALQSALSQQLDEAEATLNPDLTFSVVNAASLSLNAANCSLAPDCASLNRTLCSTVAQTCGICFDGYLGVAGPANTPCKLSSALRRTGSLCLSDTDCVSHSCKKGKCGLSAKQCPANCTSHAHGECMYGDGNGLPRDFCDANDLTCQSKCSCYAGWYGSDCSLSRDQYETVVDMREKMCISYYAATLVQVSYSNVISE